MNTREVETEQSEPNACPSLIRVKQVREKTGLSTSGIYKRLEEDPKFPRRVSLGGRSVAWVEAEVDSWVEARIAERDEQLSEAVA